MHKLTIFEMNIGHSIYGCADHAMEFLDTLGQGDGIRVCAGFFARLRRKRADAENHLYGAAEAASLAALACKFDKRITHDRAADLVLYIFERAMHMEAA